MTFDATDFGSLHAKIHGEPSRQNGRKRGLRELVLGLIADEFRAATEFFAQGDAHGSLAEVLLGYIMRPAVFNVLGCAMAMAAIWDPQQPVEEVSFSDANACDPRDGGGRA